MTIKRFTTDSPKDNLEAALNLFYIKDFETWVRGGGPGPEYADVSLFNFIRDVAKAYFPDVELPANDDDMSYAMGEWVMDGIDSQEGVIALLYTAAWAYAELRHRLMQYEDAKQDGRLWTLAVSPWPKPVASNAVYIVDDVEIYEDSVTGVNIGMRSDGNIVCLYETFDGDSFYDSDIGRTVFLTREEAEAALAGEGGSHE